MCFPVFFIYKIILNSISVNRVLNWYTSLFLSSDKGWNWWMQCIVFQQNECTFCVNEKKPHVAPNNIVHEFNIPKLILVHPYKVKKKLKNWNWKIYSFFFSNKTKRTPAKNNPYQHQILNNLNDITTTISATIYRRQ